MLKKITVKKLSIMFVAFLVLFASFPETPIFAKRKYNENDFAVSVSAGYGNTVEAYKNAPFLVTVKNNGEDFTGKLMFSLLSSSGSVLSYEKNLELNKGDEKTYEIIAYLSAAFTNCTVSLCDEDGDPVLMKDVNINFDTTRDTLKIGVLTDDINALSWLSNVYLSGIASLKTSVIKLDYKTMSTSPEAYEMLDAIIVSDYSTDRLSESQINAILEYVANGGLLMFGTGENYNKVFAGFKDKLNISYGKVSSVTSDFGVSSIDTSKIVFETGDEGYNSRILHVIYEMDWEKYEESDFFSLSSYDQCVKMYSDYKDVLINYLWTNSFGEEYSQTRAYTDSSSLSQMEKEFESACIYSYCEEILSRYTSGYRDILLNKTVLSGEYVTANILELDTGVTLLDSLTATGTTYPFVTQLTYDKGNLVFLATDITKSPFTDYGQNADILSYILLETIGDAFYTEYTNASNYSYYYGNNDYYNKSNLAENLSTGKLLPVLAYILILFAFTAMVFMAYFYLKKRGKQMLLWVTIPAFSLIACLLIFVSGISVRFGKPQVSVCRFTCISDDVISENVVSNIVFPKNKTYTIDFASEYTPKLLSDVYNYYNYYSYGSSTKQSDVTWLDNSGTNSISVKNSAAMGSVSFYFSRLKNKDDYKIDFETNYENGVLTGHITNNTSYTLTDGTIILDYNIFKTGKIAPGETVDLSTLTPEITVDVTDISYGIVYGYDVSNKILGDINSSGYMLGLSNGSYKTNQLKYRSLKYLLSTSPLTDIPGINGESTNIYPSTYYNSYSGAFTSGSKSITESDAYSYLGLNESGLPLTLSTAPYFIAFKETDTESIVADKRTVNEYSVELIYMQASGTKGE